MAGLPSRGKHTLGIFGAPIRVPLPAANMMETILRELVFVCIVCPNDSGKAGICHAGIGE